MKTEGNPPPKPAWTQKELLDSWLHQNNLVWSRLQTLSALQVAVIVGWGALISEHAERALAAAILGTALSWLIWRAIDCDLGARFEIDKKIQDIGLELPFRPTDPRDRAAKSGRGTRIIGRIIWVLIIVDVLLAGVAAWQLRCR